MNLLAVEILLAVLALKRGWRLAPLLLVVLPFAASGAAPALAGPLAPWIGAYFDPASTVDALAHGFALVGLALACWTRPAELPRLGRARRQAAGALYQI